MHTLNDITLLRRWRDRRDAHAFRILTLRYCDLVWGICNRMLKNSADAEEVAQDCFMKLAMHPAAPERSVGPWLHSVAVRGSLDRIRGERRRCDRESAYEAAQQLGANASSGDLIAHVDEAINLLPNDLRECVVRHFLEQRSHMEVANDLGVSPRTVRRRTSKAIEKIRETLRHRGVETSVGALTASLAGLKASAVPPALVVTLGKLAIGGEAQASTAAVVAASTGIRTAGGLILMKKALGIAAVLLLAVVAAWWYAGEASVDTVKNAGVRPVAEFDPKPRPALTAKTQPPEPIARGGAALPALDPGVDITPWSQVRDTAAFAPDKIGNPTTYGAITGLVLDEKGVAIAGAEVRVLFHARDVSAIQGPGRTAHVAREALLRALWENKDFRRFMLTDNAGAFAFDAIPYTGAALVAASAPGYTLGSTHCDIDPETTSEVSLTLSHARAIHGEVVNPSGQPVVGATVGAEAQVGNFSAKTDGPTPDYLRVQTDNRGYFTLWLSEFGVEEEMYTALYVKSPNYGEALFFPVAIGREERVRLTLKPELGQLAGEIRTDKTQPAAGYHVLLLGRAQFSMGDGTSMTIGQDLFFETVTNAEGHYEIDGITTSLDYDVTLYTHGQKEVTKQQLPKLKPGETTVWNYDAVPTIHVSGEVRGIGTNTPIPGAMVFYWQDVAGAGGHPIENFLKTDENGAFEATITSGEGTYRFMPRHQNFMVAGQGQDDDLEKAIDLRTGEDAFIVLELPLPWTRRFQIVDQLGQPVQNARATMGQRVGERTVSFSRPENTDADGFVEFGLLDPRTESDFLFKKEGYIAACSAPAAGEPGETLPIETFVLYQNAGVSVRLTDAAGYPLAGEPVFCTATYGDRTTTVDAPTDGDGRLVLDQALPGTVVDIRLQTTAETGGSRLQARMDGVELTAGMSNDLGSVSMTPDAKQTLPEGALR